MEIRKIKEGEMIGAIDLIWRTFLEFEAQDYTEEIVLELKKTIEKCVNDEIWMKDMDFFGAFDNNELLGVIATKNKNHIALFFVDGKYQRQGIGRKLYEKIVELNPDGFFTVDSSPYAKEMYKHLGFELTGDMNTKNGIKFYPMKCILK